MVVAQQHRPKVRAARPEAFLWDLGAQLPRLHLARFRRWVLAYLSDNQRSGRVGKVSGVAVEAQMGLVDREAQGGGELVMVLQMMMTIAFNWRKMEPEPRGTETWKQALHKQTRGEDLQSQSPRRVDFSPSYFSLEATRWEACLPPSYSCSMA